MKNLWNIDYLACKAPNKKYSRMAWDRFCHLQNKKGFVGQRNPFQLRKPIFKPCMRQYAYFEKNTSNKIYTSRLPNLLWPLKQGHNETKEENR